MIGVRYYDPASGKLLDIVSQAKAQHLVAAGVAHARHTRDGNISKLFRRRNREHAFASALDACIGMRAAASITTQRIRNDSGVLIAPPWVREHK